MIMCRNFTHQPDESNPDHPLYALPERFSRNDAARQSVSAVADPYQLNPIGNSCDLLPEPVFVLATTTSKGAPPRQPGNPPTLRKERRLMMNLDMPL